MLNQTKLMSAVICIGTTMMVSACAGAPVAPTAPPAATVAPAPKAADPTKAPDVAKPAPAADVPELTYHFVAFKDKDVAIIEEAVNKILIPKIGAKLKLKTYGFSDAAQKIALMLQSGETCDLISVGGFIPYLPSVATGGLAALDDLLPKNAPNLWARYKPEWWNAARVNGKIYNALNYTGWTSYAGFWARSDLIEKYKFDWKNTKKWEDWEPLFDNILKNENGVTPLLSSDVWGQFWFPTYYGYDPVDDSIGSGRGGALVGVKVGDPNRTVKLVLDTPEYRQAIDLARTWYSKGYVAKDVVPDNDMIAKRGALKYGGFMFPGTGDFSTKSMADAEWKAVPIFTQHLQQKNMLTTGIGRTGFTVCATSKNQDKAVKFIEEINQNPELYNLFNFGIEGKHWVWKDKATKIIDLPAGVTADSAAWLPNTYWQFGDRRQLYLTDPTDVGVWDRIDKGIADGDVSPVMGFTFNRKPVEKEIAQVNTVAKEFEGLNRGSADNVDAKLTEYKSKLKEAGVDKIIAEMQKQVNDWSATLPKK